MTQERRLDQPQTVMLIEEALKEKLSASKRVVYYPGAGGIEETLDTVSPFAILDADVVYAIDIYAEQKLGDEEINVALTKGEARLRRYLGETSPIEIVETENEWVAKFWWNGRERKFVMQKSQIDATTHIPQCEYNVLYTHRGYRLLSYLPNNVVQKAAVIVDIEQYRDEKNLITEWANVNLPMFRQVDMQNSTLAGTTSVLIAK